VTTRSACFQLDQHRRTSSQKSLSNKSSFGRGALEHDKLLTKRQIFEKKAVSERKKRTSVPKQSLPKRNMRESYNRALVETIAAMLLIPKLTGVLANENGVFAQHNGTFSA